MNTPIVKNEITPTILEALTLDEFLHMCAQTGNLWNESPFDLMVIKEFIRRWRAGQFDSAMLDFLAEEFQG